MIINRAWAMPNKNTFSIKPIGELIKKWFPDNILTLDPFANTNRIAGITNDLDKSFNCTCSMDAYEFLQLWKNDSMLGVLFDPPI